MLLPKTVKRTGDGYACTYVIDFFNKRVRLDDYKGRLNPVIDEVTDAAVGNECEKVIIKARKEDALLLMGRGFILEAAVDRFYSGSDMEFYCKYLSSERRKSDWWAEEDEMIEKIRISKTGRSQADSSPAELKICTENDAEGLAFLYSQVFKVYPVPVTEPAYLKKAMADGTTFMAAFMEGKMVGAASAEVEQIYGNAEVTDCATLPEYRQYGLMQQLISSLEVTLRDRQIFCLYTIARAKSYGMNAVFHKLGYEYRGRLANNCVISEGLEDMNVWVKDNSAEK